jgi:hypothetical protein
MTPPQVGTMSCLEYFGLNAPEKEIMLSFFNKLNMKEAPLVQKLLITRKVLNYSFLSLMV